LFLHHRKRHRDFVCKGHGALSADLWRAYAVLGVTPGAGLASVRTAFRTLAREQHPDRFVNQSAAVMEHVTRRFRECTHSYRLLTDFLGRG
jgi:DnaJ-class molecular chaperone